MIGEGDVRYNEVFEQVAAANKSKVIYAEKVFSCQECGCREGRQHFCMHRVRDDRKFEVDLDLTGNYQRHNILTAAATVDLSSDCCRLRTWSVSGSRERSRSSNHATRSFAMRSAV